MAATTGPGRLGAAARALRLPRRAHHRTAPPPTCALTLAAGVLGGIANLLFLAATGHGQLAIVAVLTALYPAVTVVLARTVLAERLTRLQTVGLLAAAAAITLVTAGR